MSQTLCHYPAIVSKDSEAPPWLPWKLFKSDGAKIRTRIPVKRRIEKYQCPLMNAYLVESVIKRTEVRVQPSFPLQTKCDNKRPIKPTTHRASTHLRYRSAIYSPEPSLSLPKARPEVVRRSLQVRKTHSIINAKNRGNDDPYGRLDVSRWSIAGETPRSVGLSRYDSDLI